MGFSEKKEFSFGGEQPDVPPIDSSQEVPEKTARRKSAFMEHFDRILEYQQELTQARRDVFDLDRTSKAKGASVALQILAGSSVAFAGPALRGSIDPYIGASASFFGTQVASHGVMEWLHHGKKESKEKIDRMRKKERLPLRKTVDDEDGDQREVSERSLRSDMLQLQCDVLERTRKEMIDHSRSYKKYKEDFFPSGNEEHYEKYLERRLAYMDRIISAQEQLLDSMVDAHILSSLHEKERNKQTLGFATAAALLEGGHAVHQLAQGSIGHTVDKIVGLFSSLIQGKVADSTSSRAWSSLMPTFVAIASGLGLHVYWEKEGKGGKREVQRLFHLINDEIESLKKSRLKTALRIERAHHKREKGADGGMSHVPSLDDQLSQLAETTHADSLLRSLDAVLGRHFQRQQSEGDIQTQTPIVATAEETVPWTVTLEDLFAEPQYPKSEEHPQTPPPTVDATPSRSSATARHLGEASPAVKPLDRRTLVELTALPSIDRKIVHDIFMLVQRDAFVSEAQFTGDPAMVVAALESVAKDPSVTEEHLEDVVEYLAQMDTAVWANESILDFRNGHLRTILDNKSKVEEALARRERDAVTRVLEGSPHAMRSYIVSHYRLSGGDVLGGEGMLEQEEFEKILRLWVMDDKTKERHRSAVRRFFNSCEMEFQQLPTRLPGKEQKEYIVRAGLKILQENLSSAPFALVQGAPDRELRLSDLQPVVAAYIRDRDTSRIPGIGMPSRLLLESFVASTGDDIAEIRYDHKNEDKDRGLRNISTPAIIGSYLSSTAEGTRKGWLRTSHEDPKGQEKAKVLSLVEPLISKEATIETFDAFFFDQKTGREHIEVWRIPGVPGHGEIFFVMRGIERVTAAKIAGLPRIVARVREVQQPGMARPFTMTLSSIDRYNQLKFLQRAGFIDGEFPSHTGAIEEGGRSLAKVHTQVFPWLMWFSLRTNQELCRIYHSLYPDAFNRLKRITGEPIVRDALTKDFNTFYKYLSRKRSNIG